MKEGSEITLVIKGVSTFSEITQKHYWGNVGLVPAVSTGISLFPAKILRQVVKTTRSKACDADDTFIRTPWTSSQQRKQRLNEESNT